MKILSALFTMMFGLLFAIAGLFFAMETVVPTYQSWEKAKHWQATPGMLIKVGKIDNGVEADYQYTVNDRLFENSRVSVAVFKDNIGSYNDDLFQTLERHYQAQKPITVWFNPNNPQESIIDRNMRWGLFALMLGFCSVFVLIGTGICWVSLKPDKSTQKRRQKLSLLQLRSEWMNQRSEPGFQMSFIEYCQLRSAELAKQADQQQEIKGVNDSKNWMQKKEWSGNRIRSGAKNSLRGLSIFAAIWCAVCIPLLYLIYDELEKDNYAVLTVLLFPLVGVFLIKQAWKAYREWRRFGVIELEMDPFPGSIGGHVGGSLYLENIRGLDKQFKVELECVYSYVTGTGKNRSRNERIEWAEAGIAKTKATTNGIKLNFRFDVPDNLPESDVVHRQNYNHWRLRLTGGIDGFELNRAYDIPVFKTQTESKYIRHNISAQVEQVRQDQAKKSLSAIQRGDLESTSLANAFRYKNADGNLKFYFPMFRNKALTLFALIFGASFGFATIAMNQTFGGNFMGIAIAIFSIPFGLVGLIASLLAFYLPLNNLKVSITSKGIESIRRLFIFPISRHSAFSNDIAKIQVKSTGSTGQGSAQIKHHKLVVHTKSRKKFTIAEGIDGEDIAHQFRDFIAINVGRKPAELA